MKVSEVQVAVGRPQQNMDYADAFETSGVELKLHAPNIVVVSTVKVNSAASYAHMQPGDHIVTVRGEKVEDVGRASWLLLTSPPGPVVICIDRDTTPSTSKRATSSSLRGLAFFALRSASLHSRAW